MSNLDKVSNVWENLDRSYSTMGKGNSKSQFIKKLLSNGKLDDIKSLLGKLAGDIKTEEDSMTFSSLQKVLLSLANSYYQIPDEIDSLNDFVLSILAGKSRVDDFGYLLSLVNVAQLRVPERVPFSLSPSGLDVIKDGYVHIVEKLDKGVVVVKSMSDVKSFISDGTSFQNRVREHLNSAKVSFSTVFVEDLSLLSDKNVVGGGRYLVHEGVKADVIVVK